MKKSTAKFLTELEERYPCLQSLHQQIRDAAGRIIHCYQQGGKLLVCGNGGSAADSEHIVGELMKGFLQPRKIPRDLFDALSKDCPDTATYLFKNLQSPLSAISLVSQTALSTAYANDQAADLCFAQQVLGYGTPGDVLWGISTSGNSKNVLYAMQVAKSKGVFTIAMTGKDGGAMRQVADLLLNVPTEETYQVQELHLPLYHALCAAVEEEFFGQ